MPRYFFQVSGDTLHVDREGRLLDDDEAAWSLAITSTGELLRDIDGRMPSRAEILTTVTNERGAALISLRFTAERFPPVMP
ncbi:hypothetical protein [Aureimonas sp. AU20]|uniref:DUF6894 family protein n=1 Tax=Aureimonas sp. AU20 TaxID=1349819 RepID=UPI000721B557|nr:hypothetical protein [Aureimonas sp. AU20]ALN75336.1 hypothetical protein M673_21610 [Aureimonas sp. AU20]